MKLAYSIRRICVIFIVLQSHDCKSRRLRFEQSVWIWEKHLLYSMSNTLWIILGINRGNPKDLWQSSHLIFRAMIEFSCSDMNRSAPRLWAANLKWGHCKTNTEWQQAQSSTKTTRLQSGSPTLPETPHTPPFLHVSGRKEPDEPPSHRPVCFCRAITADAHCHWTLQGQSVTGPHNTHTHTRIILAIALVYVVWKNNLASF